MNRLGKSIILSIAALSAVAAPLASASADSWGRRGWDNDRHWDGGRHYRHRGNGDAIAAGVLGLAAGAIIGGAMAQPQPRYVQPAPVYDAPPPPADYYPRRAAPVTYRGGSMEPWSRGWYQFCSQTYRSFNPQTGTFRGYDGRDHFCSAY